MTKNDPVQCDHISLSNVQQLVSSDYKLLLKEGLMLQNGEHARDPCVSTQHINNTALLTSIRY